MKLKLSLAISNLKIATLRSRWVFPDKFEPPQFLCSKVAQTCMLICVLCMLCCVKNHWGGRLTKICHVIHPHYSEPGHKDTSSGGSRVIIFSKLNFKTVLKIIHPTSLDIPLWYFCLQEHWNLTFIWMIIMFCCIF